MSEVDHEYTREIVCPYCGREQSDSWEYGDDGEIDCDCGETYTFARDVSVTYSTRKKRSTSADVPSVPIAETICGRS